MFDKFERIIYLLVIMRGFESLIHFLFFWKNLLLMKFKYFFATQCYVCTPKLCFYWKDFELKHCLFANKYLLWYLKSWPFAGTFQRSAGSFAIATSIFLPCQDFIAYFLSNIMEPGTTTKSKNLSSQIWYWLRDYLGSRHLRSIPIQKKPSSTPIVSLREEKNSDLSDILCF